MDATIASCKPEAQDQLPLQRGQGRHKFSHTHGVSPPESSRAIIMTKCRFEQNYYLCTQPESIIVVHMLGEVKEREQRRFVFQLQRKGLRTQI